MDTLEKLQLTRTRKIPPDEVPVSETIRNAKSESEWEEQIIKPILAQLDKLDPLEAKEPIDELNK